MVRDLVDPFAVALENDHRVRELISLREAVEAENRSLLSRLGRNDIADSVIGAETGLKEVMEHIELVAPSDAPVLILGETGSGKEVVARTIHTRSRRGVGAVPAGQLRGHPAGAGRLRAVRPREGQLHRGGRRAEGLVRAGRRRHLVPRRVRRAAARGPGPAAPDPPGRPVRAGRGRAGPARGRADRGRDPPRPGGDGRRRPVPAGPLVSPGRLPGPPAPAPGTALGHPRRWRPTSPSGPPSGWACRRSSPRPRTSASWSIIPGRATSASSPP